MCCSTPTADLFVRDGFRGARVGRLLMHAMARLASAEDLLARWEVDERNVAAQRSYRRLGATLRTKVIAAWTPEAQRAALRSEGARRPVGEPSTD